MEKNLTIEQLPWAVNQLSIKLEEIERLLTAKKEHPSPEPEEFLTVSQASKFLGLSVPTIYSKVNRCELPVMKRGNRLYFSNIELKEYLKSGRKKTNAEIEAAAARHVTSNKWRK